MAKAKRKSTANRTEILNRLWEFQNKSGYIRDQDVEECSKEFSMSQIELEGVISFYHFFKRSPAGKFTIYLNRSIVSEFKGYGRVKEAFERATGALMGEIDPTGTFGLYYTACIGLSDFEPAALINFYPFTNLNSLKVQSIIARLKQGEQPADICDKIPDNIRWTPGEDKSILFRDYHPGGAITKLPDLNPEAVIELVKKSGLKGMGGAFFPTGLKWEFCRSEPASPKYIICNADEGEPGTFKDRALIQSMPGLLIEGMVIAAYAVGASGGIIYLRAEYLWLKEKLEKTLHYFRKMQLLGRDIAGLNGFDFDIRVQIGAGAYVCGEETALLNSLEGKRGEPRPKQFYPTQKGFLNLPTIVNNVETLCFAARVIELGVEHFLKTGLKNSPGTKLLSISGDCHRPGIYEIEWGTTVGEILEKCQADDPYYIQVSGPSGQCITMKESNRRISPEDLPCGGSFMIFNKNREILSILRNFAQFFKTESCGVCTPCRAGNFIVERKLDKIALKLAYASDFEELREWGKIMHITSRCGLGKSATNSLVMALDKFPDYFESKVDHHMEGLNKEFNMENAIREYDKFHN